MITRLSGAVVIDTETTGVNTKTDEVIELAMREYPSGNALVWRIRPSVPISAAATAVHGITDADVAGCPRFAEVVDEITAALANCECIIGYNVKFDIDMLTAEFLRCRRPFPIEKPIVVDVYRLWMAKETRKLDDAYRRFVDNQGFHGAHSAAGDVEATAMVLACMKEEFGLRNLSDRELAAQCNPGGARAIGDGMHLAFNEAGDEVLLNFGKHKGTPLYAFAHTNDGRGFCAWMLRNDFPTPVRVVVMASIEKTKDDMLSIAKDYRP